MVPVITTQGNKPSARRLLRALLTSDANIIPQPAKRILRIQLLGLGSDACDRMLAPLVEELNATRTIYPGTDLRLVYELAVIRRQQCHLIPAEVRSLNLPSSTAPLPLPTPPAAPLRRRRPASLAARRQR